jgi:putative heme iron utilization protein
MQVGKRNPFGTVTFTGIDFGGKRQTRVVPLLEKGNQLMKVRKLVILQLPC